MIDWKLFANIIVLAQDNTLNGNGCQIGTVADEQKNASEDKDESKNDGCDESLPAELKQDISPSLSLRSSHLQATFAAAEAKLIVATVMQLYDTRKRQPFGR